MQADEDVGKIALAVPLSVSKALELFLQDLCDRTYEVTLHRGAKTVNCMHLKRLLHDGDTDADEELRSAKIAMRSASASPRGRGRGRGRPPSISPIETEKEAAASFMKFEDENDLFPDHIEPQSEDRGSIEKAIVAAQSANPPPIVVETRREEETCDNGHGPIKSCKFKHAH